MVKAEQVQYTKVAAPQITAPEKPVLVSDETYAKHIKSLQDAMRKAGFDAVVIYADKEHGDNFYYFTGFEPRFEEAALVVRQSGKPHAFTTSMSLRGGLTCRAAYVAQTERDLPEAAHDYVDAMARPYFAAAATWYETVGIGVTGGAVYEAVDTVFPKTKYGWTLNPGHLCASEEWMSSPIEKDSNAVLKSGMILQMDIIPSRPPYGGINAEEGVALADEALRAELKQTYPEMWERVEQRRKYMMEELGIELKPEVLPLSNLAAYVRPLLLDHERALKVVR